MMIVEEPLASLERIAKLPAVKDFIDSLHICRKTKNLAYAKRVHMHILDNGLEAHGELGNYLVPTLVECGSILIAQQVFRRLDYRNVYSWTALIQGHNDSGEFQHALDMLQNMQENGVYPSCYTLQALVKACAKLKNVERGRGLHTEIAKEGHDNPIMGTTLVDMYAKCGSLAEAQVVFDQLPVQNVVSWNALITGYAEHGHGEEALKCFEIMQVKGVPPDAVTLVGSLKACGIVRSIDMGREIHADIAKQGLEENVIVGNTLVDMYVKGGSLLEAQEVFDKMLVRDVVSWNALLAGYAEHGLDEEGLDCLQKMQLEGSSLSHVTVIYGLNCCGSIGAITRGHELHAEIVRRGLEIDPSVASSLVVMYAKVGLLAEAQEVFDKLPVRNVVSWTALITGYAEHGRSEDALKGFETMHLEGVFPDAILFACSLKCCRTIGCIHKGLEIHSEIAKEELELDQFVASALVDMYAKCGFLAEAQEVFDELPVPNAVLWNHLTTGYAEHGLGEETLLRLEEMLLKGTFLNAATFVCSLKACASIGAIDIGCKMHAEIAKEGLERDPSIGIALVAMYAKCGAFTEAHNVLDNEQMGQNVIWWNALIAGYAEQCPGEEVLNCLEKMQTKGASPNDVTFVFGLKACGSSGGIDKVFEIHAEIAKEGVERDPFVGNTLVDLYSKFGLLVEAWDVFEELPVRDVVSWNAIMAGFAECGLGEEVLKCWQKMQFEGVSPNAVSFVFSLKVCGSIGTVDKGLQLHVEVTKKGLEQNTFIASNLVDMYARSGSLAEAWEVFDKLPVRNVVSWTALMAGYACCGESDLVFCMFERMREEGIQPNERTLLNVLTVCSHAGLVDKSRKCFYALQKDHGIPPTVEHFNCMVDLLGRAGQLNEAAVMLEMMPFQPDLVAWRAVMGASRKWRNIELGRHAFECAMGLDGRQAAAFILMFNIYADLQKWEDEEG